MNIDVLSILDEMDEYRVELYDRNGVKEFDHVCANSAQAAADTIRAEWHGCYILRISKVVTDWT